MIVGKISVEEEDLVQHVNTSQEFMDFCASLVPQEFRHVQGIIENQEYYCCLLLRQVQQLSWPKKREIINSVMSKVRIVGYVDSVIEVSNLWDDVDVRRIQAFKEREL